ncbi:MarR family winged helix-turn-helix transcriptional regulator [Profundibacter sp.]
MKSKRPTSETASTPYRLDDQVGYLLRRATQRHLSIYGQAINELTPMQFATLAKLAEAGALSQNALGRLTAMDGATIKGVVDRLKKHEMVQTENDKTDRRRTIVSLTDQGRDLLADLTRTAQTVSIDTLKPLTDSEQAMFLHLLRKLT